MVCFLPGGKVCTGGMETLLFTALLQDAELDPFIFYIYTCFLIVPVLCWWHTTHLLLSFCRSPCFCMEHRTSSTHLIPDGTLINIYLIPERLWTVRFHGFGIFWQIPGEACLVPCHLKIGLAPGSMPSLQLIQNWLLVTTCSHLHMLFPISPLLCTFCWLHRSDLIHLCLSINPKMNQLPGLTWPAIIQDTWKTLFCLNSFTKHLN